LPKIIFFLAATLGAIGSATIAGLIVAVIGLALKMPATGLLSWIAGAAAAGFAGAIALFTLAAILFYSGSEPPADDSQ
jgi:hypothetical protein